MTKLMIHTLAITITALLAPHSAAADHHHPRCETVGGELEEDPADAASCPAEHPSCYRGGINGDNLRATTLFWGEGAAVVPPASPNWLSYSGVNTYTTRRGSFATRETGLISTVAIPGARPDGATASMSMEVLTGGTGEYANATGYIFVNGFSDENHHVSSHITGRICFP